MGSPNGITSVVETEQKAEVLVNQPVVHVVPAKAFKKRPKKSKHVDLDKLNPVRKEPPLELRRQLMFEFDTEKHQLAELIREAFLLFGPWSRKKQSLERDGKHPADEIDMATQEGSGTLKYEGLHFHAGTPLARLHETFEGKHMQKKPPRTGQDPFGRAWMTAITDSEFRKRIDLVFDAFVRDVVARELSTGWHESTGESNGKESMPRAYVIQAEPSIRVHVPHAKPLGVPHRDSDYFHQPGEINFWIPVVGGVDHLCLCQNMSIPPPGEEGGLLIRDSNSLYSESEPGKGDFQPFRIDRYGQGIRFYGNQCRHYTVMNETDVTRVSIDIRVIPKEYYVNDWRAPRSAFNGKDNFVPFQLGGYYREVQVEN